jgi:hypothetical protein
MVERQRHVALLCQTLGVETDHLLLHTGERTGEHEPRPRSAGTVGRTPNIPRKRQSVADELHRFRDDPTHAKRLTNARAVSATSCHPLSIVSE